MSVTFAPEAGRQGLAPPPRPGRIRPGFFKTTLRIVWVLALTSSALVAGIVYQARKQCPEPCWIDGLTPVEAMRGAPKPFPAR